MTANAPGDDQSTAQLRRPPSLGAVASGVVSLLLVASIHFLPLLSIVTAPLGLIPIARFVGTGEGGVRAWGWVVLVLVLAAASGAIPFAPSLLAAYLLLVVLPASTIELWRHQGWNDGRWAAVTILTGVCACLIVVAVLAHPLGPVEGTAEWLRDWMVESGFEEAHRSSGVSRGEADLQLDLVEGLASWALPSVVVAYLAMVLFWIRPRLPVLGLAIPALSFERYRSDEWLPAVFAVSGLATLTLPGTARWAAMNVLVAVLILYFVHGLAIIRAHLARWIGRGWAVRWGVGLLSLQLWFLVAALGLTDSFFSLRPRVDDHGSDA